MSLLCQHVNANAATTMDKNTLFCKQTAHLQRPAGLMSDNSLPQSARPNETNRRVARPPRWSSLINRCNRSASDVIIADVGNFNDVTFIHQIHRAGAVDVNIPAAHTAADTSNIRRFTHIRSNRINTQNTSAAVSMTTSRRQE